MSMYAYKSTCLPAHLRMRLRPSRVQIPFPKDWTDPSFPESKDWTRVLINRLTVPNMAYGYPAELGGL